MACPHSATTPLLYHHILIHILPKYAHMGQIENKLALAKTIPSHLQIE